MEKKKTEKVKHVPAEKVSSSKTGETTPLKKGNVKTVVPSSVTK